MEIDTRAGQREAWGMRSPPRKPAVFVFALQGCGACEEYVPRFKQAAGPYRGVVPIGIYDVGDGHGAEFGNKMGVRATPTTVVMDRGGRLHKVVGAIGNAAIKALLDRALRA